MADLRRDLGSVIKEATPAALHQWLACRAEKTTADLQAEESSSTDLPRDVDLALARLFEIGIDSCALYLGKRGRYLDGKKASLVEMQKNILKALRCLGK